MTVLSIFAPPTDSRNDSEESAGFVRSGGCPQPVAKNGRWVLDRIVRFEPEPEQAPSAGGCPLGFRHLAHRSDEVLQSSGAVRALVCRFPSDHLINEAPGRPILPRAWRVTILLPRSGPARGCFGKLCPMVKVLLRNTLEGFEGAPIAS